MIGLFPYYYESKSNEGLPPERSLWGGCDICRRCGEYLRKRCFLCADKDGPVRCKRGISCYHRGQRVYFGLRIEGCFNRSIRELFGFVLFEMQLSEVEAFMIIDEHSDIIDNLSDLRAGWLREYVSALKNVRLVISSVKHAEDAKTVMIDDVTYSRLIAEFNNIDMCRSKFKVIKKIAKEIQVNLARYYQSNSVYSLALRNELCHLLDLCGIVGKWLHDEGQYISGIQGLLKIMDGNRRVYPVDFLHSIASMAYVLNLLRKHYFSTNDGVKVFPLYKLFDRYRYCMLTNDVEWKLWRINNERFEEKIKASSGFEFVVMNLYDNAVKYLPKTQEVSPFRWITIYFRHETLGLSVEICSLGPPRTKEEISSIGMKEGNRGDEEKNKKYSVPGKGIGAFQIRQYIERSGFQIKYDSRGEIRFVNNLPYREFSAKIFIPAEAQSQDEAYNDYSELD